MTEKKLTPVLYNAAEESLLPSVEILMDDETI